MKPAPQLLVLTIGQGLAVGLVLSLLYLSARGLLTPALVWPLLLAALVTAAIGGVASFFHMHQFSAARYILRRLKTSWLSREALTTGLFGGALFLLALLTYLVHPNLNSDSYVIAVAIVAFLAVLALFVTAMLYATIPAMLSWHSPITVLNFIMLALLGGNSWALALASAERVSHAGLAATELVLLVLAFIVKGLQWHVFRQAHGRVNPATGFGLPFAPYRLQDTGTTKPPYRTQTQIYPPLHPHRRGQVKVVMGVLLGVIPAVLAIVWMTTGRVVYPVISAIVLTVGLMVERWLFFADATHSSRVFFDDLAQVPSRVATPLASRMTRAREQ